MLTVVKGILILEPIHASYVHVMPLQWAISAVSRVIGQNDHNKEMNID